MPVDNSKKTPPHGIEASMFNAIPYLGSPPKTKGVPMQPVTYRKFAKSPVVQGGDGCQLNICYHRSYSECLEIISKMFPPEDTAK